MILICAGDAQSFSSRSFMSTCLNANDGVDDALIPSRRLRWLYSSVKNACFQLTLGAKPNARARWDDFTSAGRTPRFVRYPVANSRAAGLRLIAASRVSNWSYSSRLPPSRRDSQLPTP